MRSLARNQRRVDHTKGISMAGHWRKAEAESHGRMVLRGITPSQPASHLDKRQALWRTGYGGAICAAVALCLAGCRQGEEARMIGTNAVAMVEGQIITREAFERELMRRAPVLAIRNAEAAEKAALLEEMIRFEVLHQKALAAGYDKDPEIQADVKRMVVAKFQERHFAKAQHPQVSQEEIADYYREHPGQFGTPERIRVALIEFKVSRTATPEKRAEVAQKAAAVLADAKSSPAADGTFGALAQEHSEDQASRYRGGDIGWARAGDTNTGWDKALVAAISELEKPGDFGPVISTPSSFYLVRLVERQAASVRPLEAVKDGVAYLAAREKERKTREEIYGGLVKGLRIHTNQALLQSIRLPATTLQPPAGPGTASTETRTP